MARLAPTYLLCVCIQQVRPIGIFFETLLMHHLSNLAPTGLLAPAPGCAGLLMKFNLPPSFRELAWFDPVNLLLLAILLPVVPLQRRRATLRGWGFRRKERLERKDPFLSTRG